MNGKYTIIPKRGSFKYSGGLLKNMVTKLLASPIMLLGLIASVIFLLAVIISFEFFIHNKRELLVQLLAESFGIVLDIGVLGILMIWITSANERKRRIEEAQKEIDDLRFWGSDRKQDLQSGTARFLDTSLEIADVTLKRWQIGYAALKIVRCIKTLSKAGVQEINLNHCQLPYSNLSGIGLEKSNLDMVNMTGCNLSGVSLDNVSACSGNFNSADLSEASLRHIRANGSDFTSTILLKADCCYGRFINTSFVGAQLHDALFVHANLKAADFTGAHLVGVNFSRCIGLTANQLSKAKFLIRCILPDGLERELEDIKRSKGSAKASPPDPQFPEQMKVG